MPLPREISLGSGELRIDRHFRLVIQADPQDSMAWSAANRCLQSIHERSGLTLSLATAGSSSEHAGSALQVIVHQFSTMSVGVDESYSLKSTPAGARLEAVSSVGAARGLATFRQLLGQDGQGLFVPIVAIQDSPQYVWRGLMIDVARHFIPIAVLKRNLDAMELVKLNVLHLHLSDNEGFRVESKVFPKLQVEGSNGQYYTQAEIRDLVQYAQARGILIVPEFDMPGHSKSWFAAYPELSSSPGPFKPGSPSYPGLTPKSSGTLHCRCKLQRFLPLTQRSSLHTTFSIASSMRCRCFSPLLIFTLAQMKTMEPYGSRILQLWRTWRPTI